MYAICKYGGCQHRAEKDIHLRLAFREDAKPGDKIVIDDVLLVGDNGKVKIGTPRLDAKVHTTVVTQGRERKIIVYHKKRRTEYRKMRGHKQCYTLVKVDSIEA
jgi:large subunit ribosomal protein L21